MTEVVQERTVLVEASENDQGIEVARVFENGVEYVAATWGSTLVAKRRIFRDNLDWYRATEYGNVYGPRAGDIVDVAQTALDTGIRRLRFGNGL